MSDVIHTNPLWEYEDARGIVTRGHFDGYTDFGGTDVPYRFRSCHDGTLAVVSGARLKRARRIWEPCDHAQPQGETVRLFEPAPAQITGQLDMESSASRQHYIDTGSYLRVGEAL